MTVNTSLASISNTTFVAAVLIYCGVLLFSMICLATQPDTGSLVSSQRNLVAVGRETVIISADVTTPGLIDSAHHRGGISRKCGRISYALLMVAIFFHLFSVVSRGIATHRVPWGNMFEFINLATLTAMIVAAVFLRKENSHGLLGFAVLPVVSLMLIAGTALYAIAAPVVPALQSYWLAVHVSIISIGSGIFLFSGVCSVLYLCSIDKNYPSEQMAQSNSRFTSLWHKMQAKLPTPETLDKLAYRTVIIAFPLFTLGIICGAIWAESAWGRYWGWDPKETGSFITWIIYACYLHARATVGWKKSTIAKINVIGLLAMLMNLFGINLFTTGLHEYAGIN